MDFNVPRLTCEPGFRTLCVCVCVCLCVCVCVCVYQPAPAPLLRLRDAVDVPLSAPTTLLPALFHRTTYGIKPFDGCLCPEFPFLQTLATVLACRIRFVCTSDNVQHNVAHTRAHACKRNARACALPPHWQIPRRLTDSTGQSHVPRPAPGLHAPAMTA